MKLFLLLGLKTAEASLKCAKFYEHHNGGKIWDFAPGYNSNLEGNGMNDIISQIDVEARCKVEVWEHKDRGGKKLEYSRLDSNSRQIYRISGSGNLADMISSVVCTCKAVWTGWTRDSSCSKSCDGGTESYSRRCEYGTGRPASQCSGSYCSQCSGSYTKTETCNQRKCPKWGAWSKSGACSQTCDPGQAVQTRTCDNPDNLTPGCDGDTTQNVDCNNAYCPIPCPSDARTGGCWTYDKDTETCSLEPTCAKVVCSATKMTMSVKEGVFGVAESTKNGLVDDGTGFYSKDCNLGESCETHKIDGTKLTFESIIGTNGGLITLDNGIKVDATPGAPSVVFKCIYDTSVTVSSDEFQVQDVTILGTTTSTGELDEGFHLTVGDETAILLGQQVEVKATWDVTLTDISPHFKECTVSQDGQSVVVIKQGCISAAIGLTGLTSNADNVFYTMKTFTIDGANVKNQKMSCHLSLCEMVNGNPNHCAKAKVCPADGDDKHYRFE